jgi:hypothetical protein
VQYFLANALPGLRRDRDTNRLISVWVIFVLGLMLSPTCALLDMVCLLPSEADSITDLEGGTPLRPTENASDEKSDHPGTRCGSAIKARGRWEAASASIQVS